MAGGHFRRMRPPARHRAVLDYTWVWTVRRELPRWASSSSGAAGRAQPAAFLSHAIRTTVSTHPSMLPSARPRVLSGTQRQSVGTSSRISSKTRSMSAGRASRRRPTLTGPARWSRLRQASRPSPVSCMSPFTSRSSRVGCKSKGSLISHAQGSRRWPASRQLLRRT
jgi:hypothetical protein